MKKLTFAIACAATIALAGCNNNQDAVENADMNQAGAEDLNQLSTDAANTANAEAEALGTQQQQLEQENASAPADNTTNPDEADEQNVSGM